MSTEVRFRCNAEGVTPHWLESEIIYRGRQQGEGQNQFKV